MSHRLSDASARRYARALLDVATQKGRAVEVRTALHEAAVAFAGSPELREALTHPALAAERKRKIVGALFGKGEALVARLLEMLATRDRVGLLPAVAAAYQTLWNQRNGVLPAEAISAVLLEGAQRAALETAIRKATGLEVDLKTAVDPALVGGLLLKMDGRVYDGTVQGRLGLLRRHLRSAQAGGTTHHS